jgi:hypothetical protein
MIAYGLRTLPPDKVSARSSAAFWNEIVRRSRWDRGMLFQAFLKVSNQVEHWAAHPACMLIADFALLLGILDQIEDPRGFEVNWAHVGLRLPNEVHLPLAPLYSAHLVLDVVDESFPIRLRLAT